MIGDSTTDFCECGAHKNFRNIFCRDCFNLAPKELRDAHLRETDPQKRRGLFRQICEAIRAAREKEMEAQS